MIDGIMRISPNSHPERVAHAIAAQLRAGFRPVLQAMGGPAIVHATKALAALPRVAGCRVIVDVSFVEVRAPGGARRTAIRWEIVG